MRTSEAFFLPRKIIAIKLLLTLQSIDIKQGIAFAIQIRVYMQRIVIKKFGPIQSVDLVVNDYLIFIGPQASGKSTIAKLIFFFFGIREIVNQFMSSYALLLQPSDKDDIFIDLRKRIRVRFMQLFGTTKHMTKFDICFYFSEELYIRLGLDNKGFVSVQYSEGYRRKLVEIVSICQEYRDENSEGLSLDTLENTLLQSSKRKFIQQLQLKVNELTAGDDSTPIYIPACRSLLATLSDYLNILIGIRLDDHTKAVSDSTLDYSTRTFINHIMKLRNVFSQSLDDIIEEKKKLSESSLVIDKKNLAHVKSLSYKILNGEYRYCQNEERLYYNQNEYVKLSLSSSGQQEAVWILQVIFSLILNRTKTTLIIEEPEAHLFPEAQKAVMELVALFSNVNGNRVLITTHSPYVLSSLNNLLYASQVGKMKTKQVSKIIPEYSWIDDNRVGAYMLQNGELEDIVDVELRQIQAERIDGISSVINDEYEQLLMIENGHEE